MSSVEPGWYAAQGDPPGTQRYWDGNQWVGGPQPIGGSQQVGGAQPSVGGQFGVNALGGQFGAEGNYGVDTPPASFGSEAQSGSQVPQPKSESPLGWFMLYWRRWSDFQGRGRRAEYWWGQVLSSLFGLLILILAFIVGGEVALGAVFLVMILAWIVPALSGQVRRLHDTGKSGWMMLITFVPIVGGFVLLYFNFLDSDRGSNAYGMSPKSMFNNR